MSRRLLACLIVLLTGIGHHPSVACGALEAAFDGQGISTLRYGGNDLLVDGRFRVTGAFFQKPDGQVYTAPIEEGTTSSQDQTVTLAFSWGQVIVSPSWAEDRIDLNVTVTNDHASDRLVGLYLTLAQLRLPDKPTITNRSWLFYTKSNMGHNLGQPGVVAARYSSGHIAVCNEDVVEPLAAGFGAASGDGAVLPVMLYTSRHPMARERFPFIDRPIRAGGRDAYRLSIRFASPDANLTELTADLYARYAEAYPYELKWEDRRPIGRAMLASASQNWATNPRGWHHGFAAAKLDIHSEEGKALFVRDVLRYADRIVGRSKRFNAQGVIVWDIEGQEQPHQISYLGDPRSLPPEMEMPYGEGDDAKPLVDVFFEKIREGGLIPGLCLRPQRPLRPAYGDKVQQITWMDHRNRLANLAAKIKYARERWGCRLFYIDSDVLFSTDPVAIPGAEGHSATTDPELFRKLSQMFPDILLLPEWEDLRCYAYAAPYSQLDYNGLITPPEHVLKTYPQAFFATTLAAKKGEPLKPQLVESVRQGNILFFTSWWDGSDNKLVLDVLREAGHKLPAE